MIEKTNTQLRLSEEEPRRREALERRLLRENSGLATIGRIIGSTLDINDVYERFAEEVHKLISFEWIAISTIDDKQDSVILAYTSGPELPGYRTGDSVPMSGTTTEVVVRSRKGAVMGFDDASMIAHGRRLAPAFEIGYRSVMVVPLISGDQAIGALYFLAIEPEAFSEHALSLAESVGLQIAGAIANSRIHAELKQAKGLLQDQRGLLESILRNVGEGLVVADKNGKFMLSNPAAQRILGFDPTNGLLDMWEQLHDYHSYLPDTVTPFPWEERPLVKAMRGEAVDEVEMFVRHSKAPEGLWMRATATPLVDDDGALRGGVSIFRDTTRLKQAEDALTLRAEELARSNAELEQFAYVASHDLQEPLRKILAFGDRLESTSSGGFSETGRDYLQRMQDAAKRMQTLINDLLALSRVATRGQAFRPVDLTEVAQVVLSDLEARIDEVAAHVEVGDLMTIDADPTQMGEMLMNLVGNALKYHREAVTPVVKICCKVLDGEERMSAGNSPVGDLCQITIEDNGIGFDESHLDRIFTIFQRLHSRDEYEGTGVGLAICRKIAERHGGTITARSTPGQGSTFIVTLPVTQTQGGPA